jgi:predicted ABC-type ATPase
VTVSLGGGSPRLVIVAGANGVGKSTLAKEPKAKKLLGAEPAINPDDLTKQVRSDYSLSQTAADLLAVNLTELEAWRAIAENRSVALETVLSTRKYFRLVTAAHARGYRVSLLYVALPSVEMSLARVAVRVRQGGHHVPENRIRDRWPKSLDNFVLLLAEADDVVLLSNAGHVPETVGERQSGGVFHLLDPDALPEVTARLRAARLIP